MPAHHVYTMLGFMVLGYFCMVALNTVSHGWSKTYSEVQIFVMWPRKEPEVNIVHWQCNPKANNHKKKNHWVWLMCIVLICIYLYLCTVLCWPLAFILYLLLCLSISLSFSLLIPILFLYCLLSLCVLLVFQVNKS